MKLIDQNRIAISVAEQSGQRFADHSLQLRFRETSGGFAAYISGTHAAGLAAKDSILLRPEHSGEKIPYVAIFNHSPFWCRPEFGNDLTQLPARVQELLAFDGETWHCILPVCADTFKTVLRGCDTGMEFAVSSGVTGLTQCNDQLAFVYETGADPFVLVRSCTQTAAQLLGNGLKMREQRHYSEIFEYLGWCSWDALQIWVSEEGLVQKAEEFRTKGVPVKFAVIDDMWANAPLLNTVEKGMEFNAMVDVMHSSVIHEFAGMPHRFPNGMEGAVKAVQAQGIPHVGVWFPTTGYWGGFDPEGPDAKEFGEHLFCSWQRLWQSIERPTNGTWIAKPTREDAQAYYDTLCDRVKSWGADFVKIDNQGSYVYYEEAAPVGQAARNIQGAIDQATARDFNGALINCMGMPSECMFNRPDSAVSRCSDDFMPENREWFAKNILQCSYNGLLQGQYYVNDWDMWWTDDEQAKKNSLCRAISGGPVYVSDKIDRTRPEVLRPICFSDGRLPRCDLSATPTADCLVVNPTTSGKVFKIRNRVGDNGVVAVYNIDKEKRSVSGTVRPEDAGLATGSYVYYEYFSRSCGVLQPGEALTVELHTNDDLLLYTFAPLAPVVALGRTDLFIGIKAVTEVDGNCYRFYEGGKLGFISEKPIRVLWSGQELPVQRNGLLTTVECALDQKELTVI